MILKFRAFEPKNEDMIYANDVADDDIWFEIDEHTGGLKLMYNEMYHESGSGVAEEHWEPVHQDSAIFMQFTGLKDNQGRDIYAGDVIILAGYGNYTCEFPFLELYDSGAEGDIGGIVGNIHQHSHLLDKGE